MVLVLPIGPKQVMAAQPAPEYATPAVTTGSQAGEQPYNIGSPHLRTIWIDPVHGNDAHSGASRTTALRTVTAAWEQIPMSQTLTTGYQLALLPGNYPESALPTYWESRHGTATTPIEVIAADGPHSVRLHGWLNIYDTDYLYLIGLDIVTDPGYGGGGNVIHVEGGHHILIRDCVLDGFDGKTQQPQEALKINQTHDVYVEHSDIQGAFWFALDFMAVQHGHIIDSRIHNTGDDCLLLKGGTMGFRIERNIVYDCGSVGIAAGQGSGLEFLVAPWLHYDAYDLKFVNNVIYNTQNAGVAVRGGYDILVAFNTFWRIALDLNRGGPLILVSRGMRGCDGHLGDCRKNYALEGWGVTTAGDEQEIIPNRNVYIDNNVFDNPAPIHTAYGHLTIFGAIPAPSNTHIPSPIRSDDNLQLRGNLIWNGTPDTTLGIEDSDQGCQPTNPTCNPTQLRADNAINTQNPQLGPLTSSSIEKNILLPTVALTTTTVALPAFPDEPARITARIPYPDLNNSTLVTHLGQQHGTLVSPGASL